MPYEVPELLEVGLLLTMSILQDYELTSHLALAQLEVGWRMMRLGNSRRST